MFLVSSCRLDSLLYNWFDRSECKSSRRRTCIPNDRTVKQNRIAIGRIKSGSQSSTPVVSTATGTPPRAGRVSNAKFFRGAIARFF
ncbi:MULTISPECIES: hypothetical protein [unclassified Microcoleus]|uniref:hypothetical protein n=1 Tax=unclassified Microcoleus TaxID=2642155 RepID=UPI001D8E2303|nr:MULTISPECIES: hypothetical protein [unclassified Microcoleus]MCC3430366.1 hypothetical protein [Microcoleus sp. PH2017_04_SCI_O_A]MCC3510697.1 hypothetical protein [Microcoleus sp. PH2017_17_BER_D_A]MCC3558751.1 hypothetical protein [Microcoleus sp. PH2017_27_LUM_O_A]MCC3578102.1 hypothetical protein [Microcoleus sp. PH2017_32_RDM_D_A]MCC3414236.1 hypothetical protein [Microcoleus sp. PH2017_02_FOX_O_A]